MSGGALTRPLRDVLFQGIKRKGSLYLVLFYAPPAALRRSNLDITLDSLCCVTCVMVVSLCTYDFHEFLCGSVIFRFISNATFMHWMFFLSSCCIFFFVSVFIYLKSSSKPSFMQLIHKCSQSVLLLIFVFQHNDNNDNDNFCYNEYCPYHHHCFHHPGKNSIRSSNANISRDAGLNERRTTMVAGAVTGVRGAGFTSWLPGLVL